MNCPHCQNIIPEASSFCLHCGKRMSSANNDGNSNRRMLIRFTILLVGVIIVVIIARSRFGYVSTPPTTGQTATFASNPPVPQWQHKADPLNDTMAVEPGAFKWYELNVPEEVRNWRIHGKFRAQGGSGNDIAAYVLDEESFENWKNNHRYLQYYDSGKVTVGSFDLRLNPGKYFLIFSNRMSTFSNKVVTINSTIEYDELKKE